ncbi:MULTISPECIES: aspartate aminotransferase family protein [unclassified Rhodococcus (in: high G+C Gram-positive bacteria)]|uniref:aspartate aminotransferase family protein n=1 Tax=unclassified Rhodococcus (in: high G+C Gram-positive bacteria) TaxID=192944 RepID=UPI0029549E76|nr:aspartate aminotransferase family protein [Rhodococcus sp. IEGM 1343]MDV8058083.1 aspartate aminotransferase family protein [Rhodococcus sp. IEGM 1343]
MTTLDRVGALSVNGFDASSAVGLSTRTLDLVERRRRVLGPAYHLMYETPLELVRGEGVYVYDADGTRYLDMYNNVASVGHCHPRVVEAVTRQMSLINTHTRYLHEAVINYAEDLVGTFPDRLDTAMFTCTGSEANDLALRIARHATGRQGIIVTESAYHGGTVDVAACSPSMGPTSVRNAPWLRTVPAPDAYRVEGDLGTWFAEQVQAQIDDLAASGIGIAALMIDSIFASDGILPEPTPFLKPAADVVHAAGGMLIADEVQPGFGRLGASMWGFERHGLLPDIVTMGKPMGNGMPIAGLVMQSSLAEQFGRDLRYFNTFGGNPVTIAAAQAVLDVIRDEDLVSNSAAMGERMLAGLRTVADRVDSIGDVRGAGLFVGVEFIGPAGEPDPAEALRVVNAMKKRGVLISATGMYGNTLKIRPPLTIEAADVDYFLEQFATVLA